MCEFKRLKNEVLPEEELRRAKDQLKGNIILGLESSMSRMSNLARQEMYFQQFFSVDEIMDRVENVDAEQVMAMANFLFDPNKVAVTLLGRLGRPQGHPVATGLLGERFRDGFRL